MSPAEVPVIQVTRNGPYLVRGGLEVRGADGAVVETPEVYALCRCGGSANKPFCDGTHAKNDFQGDETADHGPVGDRREDYIGRGFTVHDDRTVCSHAGLCTDNLSEVFRLREEPWIEASAADRDVVIAQVKSCPSGALTVSVGDEPEPVEDELARAVIPTPDGPYRVTGGVQVVDADGAAYEVRNRQTLCRCGGSANKPFCNGTHWKIRFRAP
jgi:CDGSH-type Zn-finger protein/ferredoxin